MCYHILPISCIPILRSTVWHVTTEEMKTNETNATIAEYDAAIDAHLGLDAFPVGDGNKVRPEDWADYMKDEDFKQEFFKVY